MATFSNRGGTSMSRAQAGGVPRRNNAGEELEQQQAGYGWDQLQAGRDVSAPTQPRHPEEGVRKAQTQLLSTARLELASGNARSPLTVEPSVTAGATAEQLVANELLPPRPTTREGVPPQSSEGVFSRLYQEKLEHDKRLLEEQERAKRDRIEDRWERLESERAMRDVKNLRQLVEDMEISMSEMRRQLGGERAARLALEQQVQEGQKSVAALQREVNQQAAALRTATRHESDHSDKKIVELNTRVVELSAELEEEREERGRVAGLLHDMAASRRDLSARINALEQKWATRKSDAEIERQVHSMQDECLAQVESMSKMLDEMAEVATRVDAAEEKISRMSAEEQQRREDWESEQRQQRLQFEQSMTALAKSQHKIAIATLQRLDEDARANTEEADAQPSLRDSFAESEQASIHQASAVPAVPVGATAPGRRPQDRKMAEEARAARIAHRERHLQQQRRLPSSAAPRRSPVSYSKHDRSAQAVGSSPDRRSASTYRGRGSPFRSTTEVGGGVDNVSMSMSGRYSDYSDYHSEYSGYPSEYSHTDSPSTLSTRSHDVGDSYDEEMFLMEEGAAITIQAAYRGWSERDRQAQMLQLEREQLRHELEQESYQYLDRQQPSAGTPQREFPTPGRVGPSPGRQTDHFRAAEDADVRSRGRLAGGGGGGGGGHRIGTAGRE